MNKFTTRHLTDFFNPAHRADAVYQNDLCIERLANWDVNQSFTPKIPKE